MARHTGNYARQRKEWDGIGVNQLGLTAAGTSSLGGLDFTEARTILRMLGSFTVAAVETLVDTDQAVITLGIGIISTDASAAGATAFPDPGVEPEYPWLWWRSVPIHVTGALPGDVNGPVGSERIWFDSRSMRKVKPRETLQVIVEYTDLVGTPPITIGLGGIRVLLGD